MAEIASEPAGPRRARTSPPGRDSLAIAGRRLWADLRGGRRAGGRWRRRDRAPGRDRPARRRPRAASRTSPAPARRSSPVRSPAPSRSTRRASRGRPTSCRPTSPAPACSSRLASASSRARCSPTSSSSTRSTGRRRARSRRCSRRCRSARSPWRARPAACPIRSWSWRRRTPSSSRGRSRSRRHSSTGSSCAPVSATRTPRASARIARRHQDAADPLDTIEPVIDRERLLDVRDRVRTVRVADEVEAYLVALVRATREHPDIELGASPRATVALYRAAQAAAVLEGREFVTPDDVKGSRRPSSRTGWSSTSTGRSTARVRTRCSPRSWPRSPSRPCSPADPGTRDPGRRATMTSRLLLAIALIVIGSLLAADR